MLNSKLISTNKLISSIYRCVSKSIEGVNVTKSTKEGYEHRQFLDNKILKMKAGKGGDGAVALLREFLNPYGGPCGGNGGNGGHIIIKGCSNTIDLRNVPSLIEGHDGSNGHTKSADGIKGKDIIIKVPVGTLVIDPETNQTIYDLTEDEEAFILARGGEGGKGNKFFATEDHVVPTLAERGVLGEEKRVELEVKLLADIGLVGIPNAGKSTLLRSLTRARPKVAPYAFTTLRPHVGCIEFNDTTLDLLTICDIPGIVQDAHMNKGLGLEFLRHVERCRVLAFILDLSMDPVDQYSVLLEEIRCYRPLMVEEIPRLVVCNKLDKPGTRRNFEELSKFLRKTNDPASDNLVAISAMNSINLDRLVGLMRKMKEESVKFMSQD